MALTAAALLLFGCAPQRQLNKAGAFDVANNGIAFLSLGRTADTAITTLNLEFRSVSTKEERTFTASTKRALNFSKGLIDNPDEVLEVVGHELPPGYYAITKVSGFSTGRELSINSNRPFAFLFQVNAGEAVYLGSFKMVSASGRYSTYVSDEMVRDSEIMKKLRPEASAMPVRRDLPYERGGFPFVIVPPK
jgi:hypothetical protein